MACPTLLLLPPAGAKSLQAARPDLTLAFELPGLEVSVVDATPRELLLLGASNLRASVAFGSNPASGAAGRQGDGGGVVVHLLGKFVSSILPTGGQRKCSP